MRWSTLVFRYPSPWYPSPSAVVRFLLIPSGVDVLCEKWPLTTFPSQIIIFPQLKEGTTPSGVWHVRFVESCSLVLEPAATLRSITELYTSSWKCTHASTVARCFLAVTTEIDTPIIVAVLQQGNNDDKDNVWISCTTIILISAREKLRVCDVTNLPYGYFVTSLTAYYSCADIDCISCTS